ncbi:MAG: amino acid adenylation domain-containing protein [Candidatus Eisenbacteria bacterium]|nr:amino acid adenylation domain-containing protein [Candidatus Eisenbacteria bacterium]
MKAGLHSLLEHVVSRDPDRIAAEEAGGASITYGELDRLAGRLAAHLVSLGVVRGDRVGLSLHKSIDSLATLLGIMKAGAAYVPVDPSAPATRSAGIFRDAGARVVITEEAGAAALGAAMSADGFEPVVIGLPGVGGGNGLSSVVGDVVAAGADVLADDLAYILFTSGSTGRPKGVMLTHGNAVSFVDWARRVVSPSADDRFSSHAPFHFDLSILDLYVPLSVGATVVIIDEETGKDPLKLSALLGSKKLTVWYSTPSILTLLLQYGRLEGVDVSTLHTVLFAGEVFPVRHLRALTERWPGRRYLNLYGPTETNVCTWHEIPLPVPLDRDRPYPIGLVCDHCEGRVIDADGGLVAVGSPGELVIRGAAVTGGYWNLPERNASTYWIDDAGVAWYRTGDVVIDPGDGVLEFVGRRDRMVKRRGYRVELGEIEAGLYKHPAVLEAAVVAREDAEAGVSVVAFLAFREGMKAGTIEMKRFCAENLLSYMIPDRFVVLPVLPKTSTDKMDYQSLSGMV